MNKEKMRKIIINLVVVVVFCIVVVLLVLVSSSCVILKMEQEDIIIIWEDLGIMVLKYSSFEVFISIEFCGKIIDLSCFDCYECMDCELLVFIYMYSIFL